MKFIYLLVILSIMASFAIINAEDVEVITSYDPQAKVKLINPTGNLYKPWERPKDAPRFLKNAATIEYGTFHRTPYQYCIVETLGATKYDMQHNTTVGRNIVMDYEGGIHVSWMWCEDTSSGWRDRFVYYNYVSPTGEIYFKPVVGSNLFHYGTIVSLGAKAGYTNITFTRLPCMSDPGTILNVPLVSYHYTESTMPGHEYHSEISWDGAWRMFGCVGGGRGGFVTGEGAVPGGMPWAYTNSPEPNGYFPDVTVCPDVRELVAIWPKLDADDEGNVFAVASPSKHDTVCGIPVPNYVVFWSGSPEYNALGELEKYDYYGPKLIDFSYAIDVDIVVNRITNQVAVATYSIYDTFDCFPGDDVPHFFSLDYILRTSNDAGTTWTPREYVFGHGGLPPSPLDFDTSYFAGVFWDTLPGGLDTIHLARMLEIVGTWRPIWQNQSDVSITYDKDGYIHMAFAACKTLSYDTLNPCSLGIWNGSGILYWNSRDKEIKVVSSRFRPPRPSWVEFKVNDPSTGYVGEMLTTVRPSISVDDSGYVYIVWEQAWPMYYTYHDSLITFVNDHLDDTLTDAQMDTVGVIQDSAFSPTNGYYDMSDAPDFVANYDIMASVSKDSGRTWTVPQNITNSHAGACTAGHCLGEIDISQTRIMDNYAHIFAVQDLDAGKLLKYVKTGIDSLNGAVTVNPIIYIKIPKGALEPIPPGIKEYPTASIPDKSSLVKAYPNPFNTSVNLEWTVPVAGDVKVEIIDIKGRVIKEIYSGKSHPGKFNAVWDGKDAEDEPMTSGIYIFRMKAENAEDSQKIHLIK